MTPCSGRAGHECPVLFLLLLLGLLGGGSALIRYAVPKKVQRGSRVGNLVADLCLKLRGLVERRLRVVPAGRGLRYLESGALYVNERMYLEQLCGPAVPCLLTLEVVAENPLELYSAVVEVQDINNNDPAFLAGDMRLDISESVDPGAHFLLESVQDPDVGVNFVQTYRLSPNGYFTLSVHTGGEGTK